MITNKYTGNLGNKLFQIWAGYGIAENQTYGNEREFAPKSDPLFDAFKGEFFTLDDPEKQLKNASVFREPSFAYRGITFSDCDYILHGYWQSEKYWKHIEAELREMFQFDDKIISQAHNKLSRGLGSNNREVLCISVRRGDFVGNKTYYQLPITYYIGAMFTHFPNWKDMDLLILSDDIEYCKVHFECLPNAIFAEGLSAIEQLALGSMADHYIISNSTFSWWCAYLGNRGKVIRPKYNFGDEYRQTHPEHDFWPEAWQIFEHEDWKIDLSDTTFMIPVKWDHKDRTRNLGLSVCMLQRDFKTNIIVMEQGGRRFENMAQYCRYEYFEATHFHRTKMLNQMALMANTEHLVNYDCDVLLPPLQLWLAIETLRNSSVHFAYPYDGRFDRVNRLQWWEKISKGLDVGIFQQHTRTDHHGKEHSSSSVGGAVCMTKRAFLESGMENERMISYAPEDVERWDRWLILGYKTIRITGRLFHIDHWRGPDSCSRNPFFQANHMELAKIRKMDRQELADYVRSWPWRRAVIALLPKSLQDSE